MITTPDVSIGFDLAAPGSDYFTLDDATKGVLDNATYLLAGEVMQPVAGVRSVSTRRGRGKVLDKIGSGTCSITLDNRDRAFDPLNTAGAHFGQIVPRKPVRVEIDGQPIFTGQVEDWAADYDLGGHATATATCTDGLALIAEAQLPALTWTTGQTTGTRITAVLDRNEVLWPDGKRDIDAGAATLAADTTNDNASALAYLQTVASAEPGALFIDRAGALTFKARTVNPTTWTDLVISDDGAGIGFANIQVSNSSDSLFNDVSVIHPAGTATAQDTASQTDFGVKALNVNAPLGDATQAQNLADWLVGRYGAPRTRVEQVTIRVESLTVAQRDALLALDLTDVVRLTWTPAGAGAQVDRWLQIEAIQHDITPGTHRITFGFSDVEVIAFVLDSDQFGVLDASRVGF